MKLMVWYEERRKWWGYKPKGEWVFIRSTVKDGKEQNDIRTWLRLGFILYMDGSWYKKQETL